MVACFPIISHKMYAVIDRIFNQIVVYCIVFIYWGWVWVDHARTSG